MELTTESIRLTKANFNALIAMLEAKQLKYTVEDTQPDFSRIRLRFTGKDLPVTLHILIRADRQIVSVLSAMPYRIEPEHRYDIAVAMAAINHKLADGSFELDVRDGELRFRMTTAFPGVELSDAVFSYLIYVSAETIDRYNDKFLLLNTGEMTLAKFLEQECPVPDI